MPITFPPGFPAAANFDYLSAPAPTTVTMPHSYGAAGDLAILCGYLQAATAETVGVGGTQSVNWQVLGNYLVDAPNNVNIAMVAGTPSGTASADEITIEYESGEGSILGNWWPISFTAGLGPETLWNFGAGVGTSGTGTTIEYESLTGFVTSNPQAALWFACSHSVASGTNTGNFVFVDSPGPAVGNQGGSGNEICYNLAVTSGGGPYAPTSSQSAGFYDTIGVVIEAYVPVGYINPPPSIVSQAVSRASSR